MRGLRTLVSAYPIALILLLDSARSATAEATWISIGPDSGADIRALAIDPRGGTALYTGTSRAKPQGAPGGTVYKSADGGSTWAPAGAGLPDRNITALAVHPQTGA